MVGSMKLCIPLLMTFFCVVLQSVLGGLQKYYISANELLLEECWKEPKAQECASRCSKYMRCYNRNQKCCWSQCGYICWQNDESLP
ncbi:protein WFDC11 [Lemur catta]|uniref:protein WFDC11 n=1 Tax=Lemur catta TaxID=9447 RepID=UPI001E26D7F1|nr:protein WFDC11 [Lemur catta]